MISGGDWNLLDRSKRRYRESGDAVGEAAGGAADDSRAPRVDQESLQGSRLIELPKQSKSRRMASQKPATTRDSHRPRPPAGRQRGLFRKVTRQRDQ